MLQDMDSVGRKDSLFLNRELSELEYQRRVLHESLDDRNPLLERVKFMAFFVKNMDEFFMKRVGGLKHQIDAGFTRRTTDGRTPVEQWEEVHRTARPMFDQQATGFIDDILPSLAKEDIDVTAISDLDDDERSRLARYFESTVLPTLTPLTVGPTHPFPFISNLSLSLGVFANVGTDAVPTFTRIKVPPRLPRLIPVDSTRFVTLQDLIAENVRTVMPGVDIIEVAAFRITRNAEVDRHEEIAEDLVAVVEEVIELRRFAQTVRLEVSDDMSEAMASMLATALGVSAVEIYRRRSVMDPTVLFDLFDLERSDLKEPGWVPRPHPRFHRFAHEPPLDVFREIRRGDILLHHPYHSFDGTVQQFLDAAAHDPDVLAIKAAIYRTASESKVMETLIQAAHEGKQVAVMVELKARFDEEANLVWVRQLEEHGIHVAYGKLGLKTHTKAALVVRRESDAVRLYSHVGTGNYHSGTARSYVDLGLLTVDDEIGQDLVKVFNYFTGPSLAGHFNKLLIAPVTMRRGFVDLIRREVSHHRAGRASRMIVKVNALEDQEMISELYLASQAGVPIDAIARDVCRLRPGLPGVSETIRVHSLVGRFLEHARIFYFENGGDPEYYIGSADWMHRNLDARVEAVTPIEDDALRRELAFILDANLRDNRRRWVMDADGVYTRTDVGDDGVVYDAQTVLMQRTAERELVVRIR